MPAADDNACGDDVDEVGAVAASGCEPAGGADDVLVFLAAALRLRRA